MKYIIIYDTPDGKFLTKQFNESDGEPAVIAYVAKLQQKKATNIRIKLTDDQLWMPSSKLDTAKIMGTNLVPTKSAFDKLKGNDITDKIMAKIMPTSFSIWRLIKHKLGFISKK